MTVSGRLVARAHRGNGRHHQASSRISRTNTSTTGSRPRSRCARRASCRAAFRLAWEDVGYDRAGLADRLGLHPVELSGLVVGELLRCCLGGRGGASATRLDASACPVKNLRKEMLAAKTILNAPAPVGQQGRAGVDGPRLLSACTCYHATGRISRWLGSYLPRQQQARQHSGGGCQGERARLNLKSNKSLLNARNSFAASRRSTWPPSRSLPAPRRPIRSLRPISLASGRPASWPRAISPSAVIETYGAW